MFSLHVNICFITIRSSHPETFCKKKALKSFAKLKGKYLCRSVQSATSYKFITRDPYVAVFLSSLRNVSGHLFYRALVC